MDRRRSGSANTTRNGPGLSTEAGADALGGILSVVDHGGAQGTNKYGLLLVLIDLAQETEFGEDILLDDLALKSLELYWPMSLRFPDRRGRLQQVRSSNRSIAALSVAEQLRSTSELAPNIGWAHAEQHFRNTGQLDDAVRRVGYKLWRDSVVRVQNLPGSDNSFLFTTAEEPRRIRFRGPAQESLVRHGPLLREIIQHRFVSFVSAVPRNDLVQGASSVHQYLFPEDRRTLPPRSLVNSMLEVQGGMSPYSGRPVKVWQINHVVPWSRAQLSMIENFAVIPSDENLAKGQNLLAPEALDRWISSQTEINSGLPELALKHGWLSDPEAQLRVLQLQYRAMRPGDIVWGPGGVRPASYVDIANAVALMAHAVGRVQQSTSSGS